MALLPFGTAPATISGTPQLSFALSRGGWSVISDKTNNFDGSSKANAVPGTPDSTAIFHTNKTGKTITAVRLGYANYGKAASTESSNTSSIQLQGTVQFNATANVQPTTNKEPFYFNGNAIGFLSGTRSGFAFTDDMACTLQPGDGFYESIAVQVSTTGQTQVVEEVPTGLINSSNTLFTLANPYVAGSTQVYLGLTAATLQLQKQGTAYTETSATAGTITFATAPATGSVLVVTYLKNNTGGWQRGICTYGGSAQWGNGSYEGTSGGSLTVYDGGSTAQNAQTALYNTSIILGKTQDGSIAPSIAICGDSIQSGTDDAGYGYNYGGWGIRAFANYPQVYLPFGGEALYQVVVPKNYYTRSKIAFWTTHVLDAYGRNDLVQGQTDAQIKANFLTRAKTFMSSGQNYVVPCILPAPTVTNNAIGYFVVSNQVKETTEAYRTSVNSWIMDTSASGFVAQAKAQVAGIANAGRAIAINPAANLECNSSGVLTFNGGYILGSQSTVLDGGTSSGSNSSTTLNDNTKNWTVNGFANKAIYIISGTGAGQFAGITSNTATTLTLKAGTPWSVTPDNTSVYQIFNGYCGKATSGSASGNIITTNDTTQSWTTNELKGRTVMIVAGTGVGAYRSIGYNAATSFSTLSTMTTTDNTSVYVICDVLGLNGVHPLSPGDVNAAASINAAAVMQL